MGGPKGNFNRLLRDVGGWGAESVLETGGHSWVSPLELHSRRGGRQGRPPKELGL